MTTILCVDDDHHLCQILEKALSGEGYRVVSAHDGEQALETLEEESPDLVVLDVLLPKADGFEVMSRMRRLPAPFRDTPVLLMTGCRLTPQYKARAKKLRAKALLSKPVPLDRILELVAKYVKAPPPKVEASRGAPPLSGCLEDLSFPNLLHHLHGMRASGVLLLTQARKRKALQIREGHPVAVKSNLVHECLGNRLVKQGRISEEDMDASLARMKQGEGLQGEILLAMHLLDEEELAAELRAQAEEKLFEIFSWRRGEFRFQIGARLQRANALALDLSPANLVLEGIEKRFPLSAIDAHLLQNAERFATPGESDFYRFQEIDLRPDQQAVLGQLAGTRTLGEFVSAPKKVRRTLYALLVTGLVDLRGESAEVPVAPSSSAAPARAADPESERDRELRADLAARVERLRSCSAYEVLEVGSGADDSVVQSAHAAMATKAHPDRYSGSSQAVRQLAQEVYDKIQWAFETLSDPKRRLEHELELKKGQREAAREAEDRKALEAEIQFQKGEALLRQRDYKNALVHLGNALSGNSEEAEYHAHYGWCLHLCHPDDSHIAEEAIEHVRRAIKISNDREKPYLFLGRLYKAIGRTAAAEKMFTRSVQIRPDCVDAMRELRLITMRREKGKGLIGRLLRR